MIKYILKRVAILLVTLWVVVTLSFFLMQVMPGTPYNNPKLTDEMIAMMNKQYGLDKPVWQQYLTYLWNVIHGDFGTSYQSINQPVSRLISQRLGVSVQLGAKSTPTWDSPLWLNDIYIEPLTKITGLMVCLVLSPH